MSRQTTRTREQQFIKRIESLGRTRWPGDAFRDFIELSYCAVAKLTAPTPQRADELEAQYMSIVNRYEDKEPIRHTYPELLAIAITAVCSERNDFLGRVSSEIGVLNPRQGQFFTPFDLALLMARMQIEDFVETVNKVGYVTVQDCAAGAGGLLLAFAQAMEEKNVDPALSMLASAIDVNTLAYQMCFLQLSWRGVPALVQHGNSLSMEMYESAWTPATWTFYRKHGHLFPSGENTPQDEEQGKPPVETEKPEVITELAQLPLPLA